MTRSRLPHTLARAAAALTAAGAVVVLGALPASAHVEIAEGEAAAGSEATLTFGIGHGCDGAATTKVRISLPASIVEVKPTQSATWAIELVKEPLSAPVEMEDGDSLTERVAEVDFVARTPLPDAFRDTVQLNVAVPEDAAGTTLYFPTVQECETGENDWTKIPAEGQDPEELDTPAPSLVVTEAGADGDHHDGAAASDDGDSMEPTTAAEEPSKASTEEGSSTSGDDSGDGLAIAGLVAGVLGLLVGGAAFARSRPSGP